MRGTEVILLVAILGIYMVGSAAADGNQSNDSNAYILNPAAREELIAFVIEARDFVHEVGQDKALTVFNDPKGKFGRGELYIFAYDFNGTSLAYPYEPKLVGTRVLNTTDSNGVALKRNMLEVAKRGGGFAYYIWPNPVHSSAEELKLTYILKVDEGLWLGAGVYLPGQAPIFSNDSRNDLVAFVEKARDYALNHTKEESLKAFNDRKGKFISEDHYLFADDFVGTTLVQPFQPELIGTNYLENQDPNGVYPAQAILDVARRGSGFVYYIYPDPAKNMTSKLKLSYVTKVDDEWALGSGIYWPEG